MNSTITICNIWIISFKFNWILYELGKIIQLRGCVLCIVLRSSVLVVFNHFLILDATDRSIIKSNQYRNQFKLAFNNFFIFANTLFRPSVCLVLQACISTTCKDLLFITCRVVFFCIHASTDTIWWQSRLLYCRIPGECIPIRHFL